MHASCQRCDAVVATCSPLNVPRAFDVPALAEFSEMAADLVQHCIRDGPRCAVHRLWLARLLDGSEDPARTPAKLVQTQAKITVLADAAASDGLA